MDWVEDKEVNVGQVAAIMYPNLCHGRKDESSVVQLQLCHQNQVSLKDPVPILKQIITNNECPNEITIHMNID